MSKLFADASWMRVPVLAAFSAGASCRSFLYTSAVLVLLLVTGWSARLRSWEAETMPQ